MVGMEIKMEHKIKLYHDNKSYRDRIKDESLSNDDNQLRTKYVLLGIWTSKKFMELREQTKMNCYCKGYTHPQDLSRIVDVSLYNYAVIRGEVNKLKYLESKRKEL